MQQVFMKNNIRGIIWRNLEWKKRCINVHENKNVHFVYIFVAWE